MKIVVLTGAGISQESGIPTFRDSNGLWENHDIQEVASIKGWIKNPALVLDFYNKRRDAVKSAQPNFAHTELARLEQFHDVHIITQNVDDLHERAGSTNILHLHGELLKAQSTIDTSLTYIIDKIDIGDKCELGSQLRPHIVFFGEDVPNIDKALKLAMEADLVLIVGTSMQVYPAAGLIDYITCPIWVIDPNLKLEEPFITVVNKTATEGMKDFINFLNL